MMPEELLSPFQSTAGGVMTVEAGAITGDLELMTRISSEGVNARVRYAGADEWYAVEGSPATLPGLPEDDPAAVHERVRRLLTTPGPVEHGNEVPVGLGRKPGR